MHDVSNRGTFGGGKGLHRNSLYFLFSFSVILLEKKFFFFLLSAKDFNKHSFKEHIKVASKDTKRCSALTAIREL